jgi:MoaA/NifB/PqqE/SkfB family radical SAM enzyme
MKKLCVLPFMHTLILPNGDINLCCNSEVREGLPNVLDEGMDNLLNNSLHVNIRKDMIKGKQPDACSRCWNSEKLNIKSYRQQENFTYLKYFPRVLSTDADGYLKHGVKYLDVRFNNTCNLKCIMCSSSYSSSWIDDEKQLISKIVSPELQQELNYRINHYDKESFKWSRDDKIVEAIIKNARSLERIHFAGGEPLLAKQHFVLLKELIKLGLASKLFLSYNTNGEFINQELFDLWSHFKRVKVFYSLDDIEDRNEYIRFPSKWKTNLQNFDLIEKNNPKNVDWRIAATISALNVAYLPEFIDWKISQNFKHIHNQWLDGKLLYANILEYPKYLNMNILPDEYKNIIRDKFTSYSIPRKYKKNYDRIVKDTLGYLYSESHTEYLPTFKEYLTGLDSVRGTDFKKTFPLISELFS